MHNGMLARRRPGAERTAPVCMARARDESTRAQRTGPSSSAAVAKTAPVAEVAAAAPAAEVAATALAAEVAHHRHAHAK